MAVFNTPPILKPGEPYDVIQQFMNNACQEFTWIKFHVFKECLGPKFAMYGNLRNLFSYMYDPIIQDYIFTKVFILEYTQPQIGLNYPVNIYPVSIIMLLTTKKKSLSNCQTMSL